MVLQRDGIYFHGEHKCVEIGNYNLVNFYSIQSYNPQAINAKQLPYLYPV